MKTTPTHIIWTFICLVPTLMAGQAIQENSPLLVNDASLRALQLNSMQSMTESPLLRVSNIGSSGQDGVSIELNSLSLMNPGPTMLFHCPDPTIPGSGALRLMANPGEAFIRIDNIGSSGQDGVRMGFAHPPVHNSFFDVFFDLGLRRESHRVGILGDPDFDLLRIQSYEIDTPRILERIETTIGPWTERFFDIEYDLDLGVIGKGFGNNPDNICAITKFDPMTPSVRERIQASGDDSFFDVFTDLNARSQTHKVGIMGDPDFDLLRIQSYEVDTPRVMERIETTNPNPLWIDSYFDISYNLHTKTEKVQMQDLHVARTFDAATPYLHEHVFSGNPLADGTFGLTLDLSLGRETRRFNHLPGDPDFDLLVIRDYDRATPKLQDRIMSTDPLLAESFFDISYDLTFGGGLGAGKIAFRDLSFMSIYEPDVPRLNQKVVSADPLFADSFFDIFYDLELRTVGTGFGNNPDNLCLTTTYDPEDETLLQKVFAGPPLIGSFFDVFVELPLRRETRTAGLIGDPDFDLLVIRNYEIDTPRLRERISTSKPLYLNSFFDVTHEITLPNLLRHRTLADFESQAPLEMRYEYDGLNRKIKEVCTDGSFTLSLERRLTPTSTMLVVGGDFAVEGGAITSSPPGAPIMMAGMVQMNGGLTVTGPANQVNGNLHVNGMFSSNNKFFKIDHPLDPDNKYLFHSCVESPDMMNVYNGNAISDDQGYVTIKLPDYFEALNNDFRYQLTCMGQFAQAIIDQKISDNKFVIRTDKPNVEVSWQVTGIRKDPASQRGTFAVEIDKEPEMKGKRLYQQ